MRTRDNMPFRFFDFEEEDYVIDFIMDSNFLKGCDNQLIFLDMLHRLVSRYAQAGDIDRVEKIGAFFKDYFKNACTSKTGTVYKDNFDLIPAHDEGNDQGLVDDIY